MITFIQNPTDPAEAAAQQAQDELEAALAEGGLGGDTIIPTRQVSFEGMTPTEVNALIRSESRYFKTDAPTPSGPRRGPGLPRPDFTKGQAFYSGLRLVNENNQVDRSLYVTRSLNDARSQMMAVADKTELANILRELKRVGGFYGENTPVSPQALAGTGFTDSDADAFNGMLQIANTNFVTWRRIFPTISAQSTVSTGGRQVIVTSREDIAEYTRNAFFATLGRAATKAEIQSAVKYVQGLERARSGGEAAPSPGTATEQFAKRRVPEFAANQLGKALELIYEQAGIRG